MEKLETLSEAELTVWAGERMREFCGARLEDYPVIKKPFLREPLNELFDLVLDAALQSPQAVHPYLNDYFHALSRLESEGFRGNLLQAVPWRESGMEQFEFLTDKLARGNEREVQLALVALLETREPEAVRHVARSPLLSTLRPLYHSDYLMHHACAEMRDGDIRFLAHWETVYHLRFTEEYPFDSSWTNIAHPTWNQSVTSGEFRHPFGGIVEDVSCACCEETLHHLITLLPVPEGIGVSGMKSLTLGTCLSCTGWEVEVIYYRHDERGIPSPLRNDGGGKIEPQFPSVPLVTTKVAVVPSPRRWRWQEWTHHENLQRIGGHPSWIQYAQYPECLECQRKMTFLLQLDSLLPLDENPDRDIFYWGSGGLGYFFWCDACRISACLWQCT